MITSIIVAYSDNHVIGFQNQLPWNMPADLKHFKDITSGHHVIMGRKSYESLGKPLKNRTNIVITRREGMVLDGCLVVHTIAEAIKLSKDHGEAEAFILGGGEIFKECIDDVDKMYITKIHGVFKGDAYFPEFDITLWNLTSEENFKADVNNPYDYTFLEYKRQVK